MPRKIKLHYPKTTVIEATLRGHLPPKPGDIVLVFGRDDVYLGNITILVSIDGSDEFTPFIAPASLSDDRVYHWTYAYKVPEGYASVETTND